MKKTILIALISICANAQIKVSNDNRFLQTYDGKPFFWLADTNWEMFHRLNREDIELLLEKRKNQGFNIIQAVALAEYDGLKTPNRYGDLPLIDNNPSIFAITEGSNPTNKTEYDYWDHVEYAFDLAEKKGLYIGFLPTWGDKVAHLWGEGPIIFNPENAKIYGRILAKKFGHRKNLIWILGGDRPVAYKGNDGNQYDDKIIWNAMAQGIKEGEDLIGTTHKFMTYHPAGGNIRTTNFIHNEDWLEMNAFQSGHGSRDTEPWQWVKEDLDLKPAKPTLDMEPCYEDHPVNPWDGKWTKERGEFNDYDVRARIYRGIFAGTCGVTYGNHYVWQCFDNQLYKSINIIDTAKSWKDVLDAKGANQMQFLKKLVLSRPYFDKTSAQEMIINKVGTSYINYINGIKANDGSFAMFYNPQNSQLLIDGSSLSGSKLNITIFNPATGEFVKKKKQKKSSNMIIKPFENFKDWVLIIDDSSKNFSN